MFAAWGRFVHRHRWPVLLASSLLLALSVVALTQGGELTNTQPTDTEAGEGFELIRDELPTASGTSFVLVFSSDTLAWDDPAFRDAMLAALDSARGDARVNSVQTVYDAPAHLAPTMRSEDGRRALAVVTMRDDFEEAMKDYAEVRGQVRSDTLDVVASGNLAINHDFEVILQEDLERAEVVSLPLTLLLLLLVFGSVVAALLPLGVGVLAVLGGLASVFLLARVTDVAQYALNIVTLIGLGVAIDYSLFMVNRFREELDRGLSVGPSVVRTVTTAGRAIVFSGLTVAIGLGGLLFFQGTFLASMGLAGTIVVAFAVFYALTFLPALLAILGPRVNALRLGRRKGGKRREKGMWHALAMAVMRRPVMVLLVTLAIVLAAGAPFLGIRLASGDVRVLPDHAESRRGHELLLEEFPGRDQTRVMVVARYAAGDPLSAERVGALHDLSRRIATLDDVLRVESVVDLDAQLTKADYQEMYAGPRAGLPPVIQEAVRASVGEHIVVLSVLTAKEATGDEAREIVHAIRKMSLPEGELLVTGTTAFDLDTIDYILARTPTAAIFVVVVTYVLLLLLVGSVLLPLKAILMNFLSIAASFGALVWIFQEGNLSAVLDFTPGSIDPTLPVIMFCILFGLSMDYEVLMLARMQEEYKKTGDNRLAVAEGLQKTGRLITGAAAIMVVVFSAFALAEVTIIKAIGLGLALAVALDATLVRALIVPATMRLMGDLNWWAPKWVKRLAAGMGH